jgi:acrylyl-CoA reductase (NADPH)
MFNALLLSNESGSVTAKVAALEDSALPAGEVQVAVDYSSLNYKDGLVVQGLGGLVKTYPHVPGIDFAGTVTASSDARYQVGDAVVVTGWRVGEVQWGGLAQRASVKADYLVRLPKGMTTRQAMAVGTAGLTAMLAVSALEAQGLVPSQGEVLVTGAAGGVGSVATAILSKLGYQVVASTGRAELHDYLKALGATTVIDRAPFADPHKRPLEAERFAGCIDSVGGNTLARVLTQMKYAGSVAAVGLAGGSKLEHSVIPFLLRGVNLLGIDSVMCPYDKRMAAWARVQTALPMDRLEAMIVAATLSDVPRLAVDIVKGQVRGRVVVDVNAA